jgi:hypothetical protein
VRYDGGVGGTKRIFSYEEARQLVPAVRSRTKEALAALAATTSGDAADAEEARERLEREGAEILGAWARDIEALGIEVKGPWLVDFDSGAGYYCWKWPEESLEFFHGYEEGFSGRVRIQ